tara:strand:+ start:1114 stop:1221 length:108 start_codon:yes stop_codon:yes gene_type:complete
MLKKDLKILAEYTVELAFYLFLGLLLGFILTYALS